MRTEVSQAAPTRNGCWRRNDVYVPLTVLLETEWVPRGVFGIPTAEVVRALRGFARLPRVTVESADTAAQALDWAERGLDFADAHYLAAARPHGGFVTFDKALARTGRRLGVPTARNP